MWSTVRGTVSHAEYAASSFQDRRGVELLPVKSYTGTLLHLHALQHRTAYWYYLNFCMVIEKIPQFPY